MNFCEECKGPMKVISQGRNGAKMTRCPKCGRTRVIEERKHLPRGKEVRPE